MTRIALLGADPDATALISATLRSSGHEVVLDDQGDGVGVELHLIEFDGLDARAREAALLSAPAHRTLVVTRTADRSALADMFGRHGLRNILATSEKWSALTAHELAVTVEKMLTRQIFGLERYFPDAPREHIEVRSSTERDGVTQRARASSQRTGVLQRFVDLYALVADEMVTNALYNAPVDAAGNALFSRTPRTQAVTLPDGAVVSVELCEEGGRLGIGVSDPFGSLQAATILRYLSRCLRGGDDQIEEKDGGAGLGLFQVFEAVSHFIIDIRPGVRTEMIGIIDAGGRFRDFVTRPKSFNIFVAP